MPSGYGRGGRERQLAGKIRPMTDPAVAYETVNVHRRGGAAVIELNRPERMNAWNRQFGLDLLAAVEQVAGDDEVRAVCITGAGRGFSSGADLTDMGSNDDRTPEGHPDVRSTLTQRYHPIITALRTMPKPVIAAVNGPAVGIGLSLALAADLVVAKESAYFLLAFVNIGLVPDGGSSLFVPERVGFTRAIEMAMLGERIPAPLALDWGLINRVYPDDAFAGEVDALVDGLAAGPTRSYAGTKRQLNAWLFERMEGQLELEADIQQEMAASGDFVEGVTAFAQKRTAEFRGA
jgi:2-(1,2-epoxy-1,2-dihydrophenyl)acetyl-CoA isomerase